VRRKLGMAEIKIGGHRNGKFKILSSIHTTKEEE
jgi:hypothetical protein